MASGISPLWAGMRRQACASTVATIHETAKTATMRNGFILLALAVGVFIGSVATAHNSEM